MSKDPLSGNIAWISQRMTPNATLAADPKFKKYTQQVEKCLATFDNVHEWADFIAFLTKLLKTLQGYMQYKEIPRKLLVSKRLAQCLNPGLPTGVHQRALDVYGHILSVLGTEGLKRDLPLWSTGLFPFFEYAATAVKPVLLNIYDTNYLPLRQSLRPVTKAFILALLPGLEEEHGEFFDQVMQLLDRLSDTVTLSFFLQNIWLCMLTSQTARAPALNYLSRRLPKITSVEDIAAIIGRDVGLMIRAFAAALEDDNLLVRRATLDLLLQSMKLDGAVIQKAQQEDRIILMRAATGVVLRRDSALNRRLYTWLLGTDEQSENQISYFKSHSLDLLTTTLKRGFDSDMQSHDSRPLKIIFSLLDKWEIGTPLTDAIILDTLWAIKENLEGKTEDGEDLLLAASALFEAAEPRVIWKHLFSALQDQFSGKSEGKESISLVRFILSTFRIHDEEMQKLHIPLCFSALLELISFASAEDASVTTSQTTQDLVLLLLDMLPHIAASALLLPLSKPGSEYKRPYNLAVEFYGVPSRKSLPAIARTTQPVVTVIEDLTTITKSCVQSPQALASFHGSDAFSTATRILKMVVIKVEEKHPAAVTIGWDPSSWLQSVLEYTEHTSSFATADSVISLAVCLSRSKFVTPKLQIDQRANMAQMMHILLKYLRPQYSPYHARTVRLIWELEDTTMHRHVEAVLAESLSIKNGIPSYDAYDAFGVLWRLSDDTSLPGFRFRIPLFAVLDTLRSDNPALRRIGETWMRCSLRSYMRVLDPIMYELLDPATRRIPAVFSWKGKDTRVFAYERPFDTSRTSYLLEILLATVRFGGQGLSKMAKSTQIKKSGHPDLYSRAVNGAGATAENSYLDVLIDLQLRLLQSEPKAGLQAILGNDNAQIQALSVDLLQSLVSRGELTSAVLETIENAVVAKLYSAIHTKRLDIQNKLLHLLHSVIIASSHPVSRNSRHIDGSVEYPTVSSHEPPQSPDIYKKSRRTLNPLMTQTLIDGVSVATNRPILQHWLDFILMTIPQFTQSLQQLAYPLSECVCRLLRANLADLEEVASPAHRTTNAESTVTDADFVMLLHALERLVLQGLSKSEAIPGDFHEEPSFFVEKQERGIESSTGILGYVSNVFSPDGSSTNIEEALSAKSQAYRSLHEAIKVLYAIWISSSWVAPSKGSPEVDSISLIYNRTKQRCRKALERLFRVQSAEVIESLVECWFEDTQLRGNKSVAAFELVDTLTSSAQTAVHMLCESISSRATPAQEKGRKVAMNPNITDYVLFMFLEQYLARLEGPIAIQVWGRFVALAKDIAGNVYVFKLQVFPTLRCVTTISEIICQTTAVEDKKIRKELQETFGKLVDTCVLIAGRSFEQGNWIKRAGADLSGRITPLSRSQYESEKNASTAVLTEENTKAVWGADLIDQINEFLVSRGIPNFRRLLADTDRITAVCTNLVYYVVTPAMKGKAGQTLDIEDVVLDIIRELSKISAAARAWRTPVLEAFLDSRFFNSPPDVAAKWRPLIRGLVESDKTVFPDILSRITTTTSANINIFANRDYEMLVRSLNLRRLSFILLAGDRNQFLNQLPGIQEKLVDVLKSGMAPSVLSEVYLCLRVLLCRLSAHNLSSFWPTILTELFRVFEQALSDVPQEGSEDLVLLLAACKFLDLLLVLQTSEFQIHQWMFVTDTIDAVYRPEDWTPESLLDQLAEMVTDLPETRTSQPVTLLSSVSGSGSLVPLRRPLLGNIKQLSNIKDLLPFFSQVSMSSFESVYGLGGPDWELIERGLLVEMFEGSVGIEQPELQ